MILKTCTVLLLLLFVAITKVATYDMLDDAQLNFTGLALKYGMPCKEYDVTTEDGYILKLFRIPGNKTRPVLYAHGLLDTADTCILRGQQSIGYLLSKAGYDVWAFNYRGNRYSRRHVFLNPDNDTAFWDFSMHEHGLYDLSTSIDFILNKTKVNRLSLIGHSEGTVIMFILGSLRPEYNDKINIFMAWGPICYLHNIVNGIPQLISISMLVRAYLLGFKIEECLSHNSAMTIMIRDVCKRNPQKCLDVIYLPSGYDPDGIEPEYLRVILGHFPAGTSRKNLEHFYQVLLTRRFAQFDYGPINNLVKYNSHQPPDYNLTKITMKVAMFLAEVDTISTQKDVNILKKQLPNVVYYRIFEKNYHIDFPLGRYAYKVIYPSVFKLLEKYT